MILRLAIFSIALAGALAAALAWQLGRLPPEPLPAATTAGDGGTTTAGPLVLSPEQRAKIGHLVARPPFAADRRPYQPEQPAPEKLAPAAPETPPSARLLGVITEDGERFAVLASSAGTSTDIVRRGAEIEGWVVEKIDDKGIVLRKGSATVEILLFENR